MHDSDLLALALEALDEVKGTDIRVLDVRRLTDVTDFMVIATGRSDRHVKAMADRVVATAKTRGHAPLGVEGEREAEWVLVDLTDVVVHIMQPETRKLYQLERLWADAALDAGAITTHVLET